jgi:RNA recognition motif-containing protein
MAQQFYKIFIRNLPWTVSSQELRSYFSQFGYVTRAIVLYSNDTGLSRGFGYVDFNKRDAFEAVMSQPQHVLEGQRLRIEEGSGKRRGNMRNESSTSAYSNDQDTLEN